MKAPQLNNQTHWNVKKCVWDHGIRLIIDQVGQIHQVVPVFDRGCATQGGLRFRMHVQHKTFFIWCFLPQAYTAVRSLRTQMLAAETAVEVIAN
jgi:hypothetical protein